MTGTPAGVSRLLSMWRGARGKCPACGAGALFSAYLKLNPACPQCGADFSRSETADVAPYVTIFVIGLVCVPLILAATLRADAGADRLILPALIAVTLLALALLPRVKGLLAALLWRARREM